MSIPNAEYPYFQEYRLSMEDGVAWHRIPLGARGSALINKERLVRLFSLTRNAYHEVAFHGLSTPDCMRICANMLMEAGAFEKATRAYEAYDRVIARRKRHGYTDPEPREVPAPSPDPLPPAPDEVTFVPDPPAPTVEQIYWDRLPLHRQAEMTATAIATRRRMDQQARLAAAPAPYT